MEFDLFSQDSQTQSQTDLNLSRLITKTKTQPTKFFTQLNRRQKFLSKKKMSQSDFSKKKSLKKKKKKTIPTFKQMMMSSKLIIQDQRQPKRFTLNQSTKKVRFGSSKRCSLERKDRNTPERKDRNTPERKDRNTPERKDRKTSIQKTASFNFYEAIKQMAIFLANQKNNSPFIKDQTPQHQRSDEDLFTGYTERQFQDGTTFKGICENGVIIKGQLHFQNGFVYDGELFLDRFHGKGKLTLPKGQAIEADWIEGKIVGKATIKYLKGQIYYGDVKNFRRHGQGYLFFNDGSKYEGQFNEGQLTGYGVHTTVQNQKTQGYWFYGDFIGSNEQVFENVMANAAAHEKKKQQKKSKNIKFSKTRNSRNSENLFNEHILNIDKNSQMSKTQSFQD